DAQFAKRALKPFKMSSLVDEAATPHLAYFIHAIAELIAAILDVNFGVWERQITAIDVSDAGHERSDVGDQRDLGVCRVAGTSFKRTSDRFCGSISASRARFSAEVAKSSDETMTRVYYVEVQIKAPCRACPNGQAARGYYTITDNVLTMTDDAGEPAVD